MISLCIGEFLNFNIMISNNVSKVVGMSLLITNCSSIVGNLSEKKHQKLSAKVWNSGTTSVDSLSMHGLT